MPTELDLHIKWNRDNTGFGNYIYSTIFELVANRVFTSEFAIFMIYYLLYKKSTFRMHFTKWKIMLQKIEKRVK